MPCLEGSPYAGNEIFLPTAGYLWYNQAGEAKYHEVGNEGYYWTSTKKEDTNTLAYLMKFKSNELITDFAPKLNGRSVRAVLVGGDW